MQRSARRPEHDFNSTGFLGKERFRGQQAFRTVVAYNPLIEKMGIRQVTIISSAVLGEDIFTTHYIDSWRENNSELPILRRFEDGRLTPTHWIFDQSYGIRTTNEMCPELVVRHRQDERADPHLSSQESGDQLLLAEIG